MRQNNEVLYSSKISDLLLPIFQVCFHRLILIHLFLKLKVNFDDEFISQRDDKITTCAWRQIHLPISPFFLIRTSVLDGEETGRETKSATAKRTRRERVNPESHGNLATSAIGRTCTRSNLKARSRTRESERARERKRKRENGPFFHSYTRAIRFVRASALFIGSRCFLFAVYHLRCRRRELGAAGPPGTPAEVLSL